MGLKRQTGSKTHVNLTISRDVSLAVDKYAAEYGMSRSYAIEYMCRDFLKDLENGGPNDDRN